jgi:hypothetical protein
MLLRASAAQHKIGKFYAEILNCCGGQSENGIEVLVSGRLSIAKHEKHRIVRMHNSTQGNIGTSKGINICH